MIKLCIYYIIGLVVGYILGYLKAQVIKLRKPLLTEEEKSIADYLKNSYKEVSAAFVTKRK